MNDETRHPAPFRPKSMKISVPAEAMTAQAIPVQAIPVQGVGREPYRS